MSTRQLSLEIHSSDPNCAATVMQREPRVGAVSQLAPGAELRYLGQAERVEIVSVLSLATAYRAAHPHTLPVDSRLGFAERLRLRLTKTVPMPSAPRPRSDAVHVMTCHA